MKTKLMELIEAVCLPKGDNVIIRDKQYWLTPKELQAIMDEGFREQRIECSKPFNVHSVLTAKDIRDIRQPETGIEL